MYETSFGAADFTSAHPLHYARKMKLFAAVSLSKEKKIIDNSHTKKKKMRKIIIFLKRKGHKKQHILGQMETAGF